MFLLAADITPAIADPLDAWNTAKPRFVVDTVTDDAGLQFSRIMDPETRLSIMLRAPAERGKLLYFFKPVWMAAQRG